MKTLDKAAVFSMLESRQAVLNGHFLLSSGLHSDRYIQCARLFMDPKDAEAIGRSLAALAPGKPDMVVSPALGGLLVGFEVARALDVPFVFTERDDGTMTLRRGFEREVRPMTKVLIVEDVLTTGKSTREVIAILTSRRARCIGALAVIDRGVPRGALPVPWHGLVRLDLSTWEPGACPACKRGEPAVKPGSRPGSATC